MMNGGEEELGRNPNSGDLLPFFQRYAWALIEARYKEKIVTQSSIEAANKLIRFSIGQVVDRVCRAQAIDGMSMPPRIWFQTVRLACEGTGLKSKRTRFGLYKRATFLHPRRKQLRALLLAQSRELQAEFWNRRTVAERARQEDSFVDDGWQSIKVVGRFSKRAKWLRDHMIEKGWGPTILLNNNGPTEKTTHSILAGHSINQSTIKALSTAFGVLPSEIPNC